MADDMETLDWGNEEEEGRAMNGGRRNFVPEEDAVSLGGDEEDEFLTHQSCLPQDEKTAHRSYTPSDPPEQKGCQVSVKSQSHSPSMGTPAKHEGQQRDLDTQANVPGPAPSTLPAKLVHALPRKPIATHVPSVHPSHPSIIEATAMASHFDRNKRSGGGLKTRSFDNGDSLPPGWEIKWSRTTNEHYYYNTRTEESTWTRPFSPNGYHSGDSRDRGLSVRNDSIPPRVGRSGDDGMSYNDRHYRPGESGLNTEKSYPTSDPSQVSDKQNGWSSPMPSVIPGDDRGHSTRRAHSPTRSQHDDVVNREASSSSALSVEDRVWVARAVEHRPHEHEVKQRESDRTSAQDRRYTRDTEKPSPLSTLSPSSPPYIPTSSGCRGSSRGGGPRMKRMSCETLGVELRSPIQSFLLFFLIRLARLDAWTLIINSCLPFFLPPAFIYLLPFSHPPFCLL